MLSGENGRGRLKNMEQKLRKRQQYMVTQVAQIYPVRPLDEQSPDHKPGITTSITKTSMSFSVHLSWVFSSVFKLHNFRDNFSFFKKNCTVLLVFCGRPLLKNKGWPGEWWYTKKKCSYGLIITWFTKKTWSAGGTPEGIVIKVENNLDHRSRKSPKPQFLPARGFFFNTSPVNSLRLGFKSGPAGCYLEALAARLEDLSHHHMIYSC